jgi:hypothetical protein
MKSMTPIHSLPRGDGALWNAIFIEAISLNPSARLRNDRSTELMRRSRISSVSDSRSISVAIPPINAKIPGSRGIEDKGSIVV